MIESQIYLLEVSSYFHSAIYIYIYIYAVICPQSQPDDDPTGSKHVAV
jgi:hypothetical protein